MKKIFFFLLAVLCLSTQSYADNVIGSNMEEFFLLIKNSAANFVFWGFCSVVHV